MSSFNLVLDCPVTENCSSGSELEDEIPLIVCCVDLGPLFNLEEDKLSDLLRLGLFTCLLALLLLSCLLALLELISDTSHSEDK